MTAVRSNAGGDRLVLVNPPVSKPVEPPAGIARLAGALAAAGLKPGVLDMNLSGMLWMLDRAVSGDDTWSMRAARNRARNIEALRSGGTYRNLDRYKRCVNDLNRLLSSAPGRVRLSLSDYEDPSLSPLRSADLIEMAAHPEDNPFFEHFSEGFKEAFHNGVPEYVGFSLTYLSQALTAFAMIGYVRSQFSSAKILLGGGLVTSWIGSEAFRGIPGNLVDHVVRGPGEPFLIELLGLNAKGAREISPAYSFDAFPGNDYLSPGMIMPYSTSSGCYYSRCSFCPETAEGNRYVQLNPSEAAAAMADLVTRFRPAVIHIVDNAMSPAVLKALADRPVGAPWYGFARVTKELTDGEFCRALKRAGCAMLKLGVESGDQSVLDGMGKGISVKEVSQALKALADAGIATYVYLLFGTPQEDEKSARKTLDFVVEHGEYISFLNLAVFNLPHRSPDAAGVEAKPFYGGDLSFYTDFVHPRGWDRKKVRRFIDREFTRHPVIGQIVKRQPPFFTSNHAVFFSDAFC